MDVWVERELEAGDFPDQRLKSRLGKLLADLGRRIGNTMPAACQDWAATKAAYRFFSNGRVDESLILAGHFAATQARVAATAGPILVSFRQAWTIFEWPGGRHRRRPIPGGGVISRIGQPAMATATFGSARAASQVPARRCSPPRRFWLAARTMPGPVPAADQPA